MWLVSHLKYHPTLHRLNYFEPFCTKTFAISSWRWDIIGKVGLGFKRKYKHTLVDETGKRPYGDGWTAAGQKLTNEIISGRTDELALEPLPPVFVVSLFILQSCAETRSRIADREPPQVFLCMPSQCTQGMRILFLGNPLQGVANLGWWHFLFHVSFLYFVPCPKRN